MGKKPTGRLTCISTAQRGILNRDALGWLNTAGRQLNIWPGPGLTRLIGRAWGSLFLRQMGLQLNDGARHTKEQCHLNRPLIYGMNKKWCRSQKGLKDLEDRLLPRLRPGAFSSVGLIKI